MKRVLKAAAAIMQTVTIIIVLTCSYLFFYQELSPKAAKCHLFGGKYYVLIGCVPGIQVVVPINPASGQ